MVNGYIDPLLQQRWQMFAPQPATSSVKVWFRYQCANGSRSQWLDPGEEILQLHQRNRLSHKGHLFWVHQAIGQHLFNKSLGLEDGLPTYLAGENRAMELRRRLVVTPEYTVAARYFSDLARQEAQKHGLNPIQVEFQFVRVHVRSFSHRHDQSRDARIEFYPFPPVEIVQENQSDDQFVNTLH